MIRTLTGWIVAYLVRWLPHSTPTGLFPVGKPDANSPVLITVNFTLTVKRVRRALVKKDVWLLVAHSKGINVWCAAAGGIFTESSIIDAIKISRLSEKVSHREVILPPLSAPGVDRESIKQLTGFSCRFGPVYARDIPAYLNAGKNKSDDMRCFDFGLRHRLDMFLPMNFPVYLLVAVILAAVASAQLLGFTVLFWLAAAFLYIFIDIIPGKTGWGQAMLSSLFVVFAWMAIDWYTRGNPLEHWGWLVTTFFVFFGAGFDIAGTLSSRTSDAERMMQRLRFRQFGSLFVSTDEGVVQLERNKCQGCLNCLEICPVGVFACLDANKKIAFKDQGACFACGACVKQCPQSALSLNHT
jgi:NAD-dependent dihydropyrimidine dehydrogenase PreA subunit